MDIEIYKALSDESRLRILNILMRRELCVCEIEAALEMSQSNVSRHLTKLKNADIVTSKKESQWAFYKIKDSFIEENRFLYEHLKNSFSTDSQFNKDAMSLSSLEIQPTNCGTAN